METIYKYEIKSASSVVFQMPKHAKVLSVQMQNDTPCIWAMVNPYNVKVETVFEIFGTGHEIPNDGIVRTFIGTFQMHNGSLVFHLFKRL